MHRHILWSRELLQWQEAIELPLKIASCCVCRGVGFVNYMYIESAVAAKAALQGKRVGGGGSAGAPPAALALARAASAAGGNSASSSEVVSPSASANSVAPVLPGAGASSALAISFQRDRLTRRAAAIASIAAGGSAVSPPQQTPASS
jgi:hypothetical protein